MKNILTIRSSDNFSETEEYRLSQSGEYEPFSTRLGYKIKPSLSLSVSDHQCEHNKNAVSICRNQKCLVDNTYICCEDLCVQRHFQHPQDLIPYQMFNNSIVNLKKLCTDAQISISTKIRQIMNKLLHLRVAVASIIDAQLQKLKQILQNSAKLSDVPEVKDCIYMIKEYNKKQQLIVYSLQQEQRSVNYTINRLFRRLNANISQLLNEHIYITQCEDMGSSDIMTQPRVFVRLCQKQKNYEYKIEGNIYKILKSIKTTPKHVDRLKIYLNQDTYGQPQIYSSEYASIIFQPVINNIFRRNYKETYQTLMKSIQTIDWVKKVHLVVWDNFLMKENKLQLIKTFRQQMTNIKLFIVEEKLKNVTHDI